MQVHCYNLNDGIKWL